MNLLFCFVFVSIAVASVTSASENREQLDKKTAECRKDISSLQDLSPQEVKCLGACYLEKLGLMDKANKLVPNKLNMIMDPATKNKDGKLFKDVSKDIAGKCKTITDKDKCEAALKIVTCVHDETMKLGFNADVLY
ncbi:general odorant-binding protein 56a-like [Bradysia coprophila]|uniref:general odorant-binding protein 56a-like n=1 Tax=Bradysia coprophila TaxID=38358 RepID=UPI00187DB333|nr:general odorant-binding protein 56a-like [Bradysia coprophila]